MSHPTRYVLESVLPPVLFFAAVVGVWQLATGDGRVPVYLVPSPTQVAAAAREHAGQLQSATLMTAAGALSGFAAGGMLGIGLGLVFSQSRIIANSIYPYAIFLQTVPIVAIAPLIVIWCGAGFVSVVVVSAILSLFPLLTAATAGLTRIDTGLVELFEITGASRWQTLRKLRIPHSVPYLVTGAKISSGLAVIGAIVGEIFAGYGTDRYGLGYLISLTTGKLETAYAFAAIGCSTLLSIAIFAVVHIAGATILARWHSAEIAPGSAEPHLAEKLP